MDVARTRREAPVFDLVDLWLVQTHLFLGPPARCPFTPFLVGRVPLLQ